MCFERSDLSRDWQGFSYELNWPGVIPQRLGTKLSLDVCFV